MEKTAERIRTRLAGRAAELGAETVEVVLGIALVCGVGAGLYGMSGALAGTAGGAGAGISAAFNGMGDAGAGSAGMGDAGSGGSGGSGSGSGSGGGLTPGGGSGSGDSPAGGEGGPCAEGGHDWGEWRQVAAATCEQDGSEKRTCAGCGETQTRTVASEGHDYVETKVKGGVAATCTADGVSDKVRRACSRCGDVQLSGGDVVPALGHDFSVTNGIQWSGQSASCTFSCSRCGASETVRATVTVAVKAAATCTEKGHERLRRDGGELDRKDSNGRQGRRRHPGRP